MPAIRQMTFHFPFPDRQWSYNCRDCGGKCCKGHGLPLLPRDVERTLSKRPGLELLATVGPTRGEAESLAGGCVFLEDEWLCAIHRDHGAADKPFHCRTFPFNVYQMLGPEVVVVVPRPAVMQATFCPLEQVRDGECDNLVSHESIARQLDEDWEGFLEATVTTRENPGRRTGDRARSLVAFEEACQAYADSDDGDNLALWACLGAAGEGAAFAVPDDAALANAVAGLEAQAASVARALECDPADRERYDNRHLRSLTSTVRALLLTRLPELEDREVHEMAGPTLVALSMFCARARQLAPRPMTLADTILLVRRMFWAAVYAPYLDLIPWLEPAGDNPIELPRMGAPMDAIIDAIAADAGLSLAALFERHGLATLPQRIYGLKALEHVSAHLRFSET